MRKYTSSNNEEKVFNLAWKVTNLKMELIFFFLKVELILFYINLFLLIL